MLRAPATVFSRSIGGKMYYQPKESTLDIGPSQGSPQKPVLRHPHPSHYRDPNQVVGPYLRVEKLKLNILATITAFKI